MRNLPLKALQTFEAVARHNSFHGAAKELFVTPSAVSHQIKNLETWLECSLFLRRGNQLELLPHAKVLAAELSLSLAQMRGACTKTKHSSQAKNLVIAAIPSVATCWLIPRLQHFQRQQPDITLRVTYAIHGTDINFADVDIAFIFCHSPPIIQGAEIEKFRSAESYPVCSTEFLRSRKSITLDNIAQCPLLHDAEGNNSWKDWFKKSQQRLPMTDEGPSFDDFNLLRSATLAGQGIALCPTAMIADDLQADRLVQLSDICVSTDSAYYLIRRLNIDPLRASSSQLFRDWAFEQH